ncbi:sec-independent protein translocase protein TatA [Curtobacterium sp. PhB137]|uniref:twin-arginine translocase TatA/TatE family subunit n=1 Tax=Curtobacterium sp. PhB137 TaxID=2485182 RepID=UPI000F50EC2B|nr:twin-arginine translocase TatA/TatE family subunit [Curtobacterium sp. PhB137]RPE74743.1 sec-independent protein translocase protein TatA [Curtobacterium sp. PhB137]
MLGNLTGIHLLIILGIVVLLFGATKLPALAKGLGQSLNIFRSEIHAGDNNKRADQASSPVAHDGTVPSHE